MAPLRQRRTFTAQEANAALPLVRAIVRDLVEASREVVERRERLSYLIGGRSRDKQDPYREELAQIEDELEKDSRQLQEYVEELHQLGVEPKSAMEGLVDFPALFEGRLVYLCWKLGEPEVLYWHELEAGFAGRQLLTVESLTAQPCANQRTPS
jgi:hypothetical protein